jgi:LysM repeat protein
MSYNCPVCNKTGLPDYKTIEVTCSQCNSNLKAYMLLDTISRVKEPKRTNFYIPASITLLAIAILIVFFNWDTSSKKSEIAVVEKSSIHSQSDSVIFYKDQIAQLKDSLLNSQKQEETFNYKIKSGDCLSEISYNFYGDWRLYKTIEEDNNLQKPYKLSVGQILKIKIKTQ